MKKLVAFECLGLAVVPWSVPEIGVSRREGCKPHRFTRRSKKSRLAFGKASLDDWQRYVAGAAREAMAAVPIPAGPVRVHMEFLARTPAGRRHGELWDVPLRFREDKGAFTKTQPRGKPEADLVNMFKGTEDAIQGVVFEDDVQSRMISAIALFGPADGVRVSVYAIEPGDFPGRGEPVD